MKRYHLEFKMKGGSNLSCNINADYEPEEFTDKALTGKWFNVVSPGINTMVICVDDISSVLVTPMEIK